MYTESYAKVFTALFKIRDIRNMSNFRGLVK